MTTLADPTDPRFTADQLHTLAAFEAAPTPPEVAEAALVETVARAIGEAQREHVLHQGQWCSCGWRVPEGDPTWLVRAHEHRLRTDAAAAIAAYRAQDGGAEEAVLECIDPHRYPVSLATAGKVLNNADRWADRALTAEEKVRRVRAVRDALDVTSREAEADGFRATVGARNVVTSLDAALATQAGDGAPTPPIVDPPRPRNHTPFA